MPESLNDVFATLLTRIRALETRSRAPRSYYNLVGNGGFEVWSHGIGPFVASGETLADGWKVEPATTTLSVTQDTTHQDDPYSATCAACVAGGAGAYIYQTVSVSSEFTTPASLVSISIRVRTATAGAVQVGINGIALSAFHSGSDRYETLVVVLPPGAPTWNVQVLFSAACVAYVDNAMVVQGPAPIDYVAVPPISTAPWAFEGQPDTPTNGDTLAFGTSVTWDWGSGSRVLRANGIHIDVGDTTQLVFENSGRYRMGFVLNPSVPTPGAGTLVPINISNDQPDGFLVALQLPMVGTFGDFSSYHYPSFTMVVDVVAQATMQIVVDNLSADTDIMWLQFIYLELDYLGPIN